MLPLPITRVVLFKHGVGYFEREGQVHDDATLSLTFKLSEVSDVLKSLTILDLNEGHIASVSYDSTKPLDQLLSEVALGIPDEGSLVSLLPQIKGARVALHTGVSDPVEGVILGIDSGQKHVGDGIISIKLLSILTDQGDVRSFDLHNLFSLQLLDNGLRKDLDYYLRTQLSSKKKDSRTFTFFTQGQGERTIRLSYTLGAPVWKATYRILLGEEGKAPLIQGWAVVDNTQDEDWENVSLALIAGLPVSFIHDLYTPRFIRRPEILVQETTGVLPPEVEAGMDAMLLVEEDKMAFAAPASAPAKGGGAMRKAALPSESARRQSISSMPAQVRERQLGDLFEYGIEHPVTIRRNQSALVPILLKPFEGRPVLLYNKHHRPQNPMRCVEFRNTTGLTLEGGPVTVLEGDNYVGEAMLDTLKPDAFRLVPYAVELSVLVLTNVDTHRERVHRVSIRQGMLRTECLQVEKTTYRFQNQSPSPYVLYLEHPRSHSEWKLVHTPEPMEITENYWRFRTELPAKQTALFVVQHQQTLSQSFALGDLTDRQLQFWIDQKYLDARTEPFLKQIHDLHLEGVRAEQEVQGLEREKAGIYKEQERIRANLASLGDRSSEKELRERFVSLLGSQENRLERIGNDLQQKNQLREQSRARIAQLLSQFEYESAV